MRARFRLRWTWLLPVLVIAHASIWAIAVASSPVPITTRHLAGEFFSTLALVIMSMNLILSTRARPLERGFGGLDKLFASHRADGITAASLIVAHFLVIPKSVGYVTSKPIGYSTIVLILASVLLASAPRTPWRRLVPLKYQTWKATHRFMGVFVAVAVAHSLFAHPYVRQVPLLHTYVYGIAFVGLFAWVYREALFGIFGPFRAYRVSSAESLPDGVLEVRLSPEKAPMNRRAGQFAFVSFDRGPSHEQHPFTVSIPPEGDIRFSIKASGDYTRALGAGLPVGSVARIEGPYGRFDYRLGNPRQLWLAGGIGITPFLSMAADLDRDTKVALVWSVRDESEALYLDELRAAAQDRPNLGLIIHPTKSLGHLRVAELDFESPPAEYSVFICGPVVMRADFVRQLRALGVPHREIYFEEFSLR